MEKIITFYKTYKRSITLGALGILALSIPVILSQVLKQQDIRQRAAESNVTLSLSPHSETPAINSEFDVNLVLSPRGNDISAIDGTLKYDSTKLELLPSITVGSPYNLLESQSITTTPDLTLTPGANSITTKRIVLINQSATTTTDSNSVTVATFRFKALTLGTASVSFGDPSGPKIAASGVAGNMPLTSASQLAGSYIIGETIDPSPTSCPVGGSCPTPTPTPATTPTPTTTPGGPTPTPTVTPTPSATPTLAPNETRITISFSLPGIAAKPNSKILLNDDPENKTRLASIRIFDVNGAEVETEKTGNVNFSTTDYKYKGTVSLGTTGIATGTNPYIIFIKLNNSLWKRVGVKNITKGSDNDFSAASVSLVTGDIDGDGKLTASDYIAMLGCILQPPNNIPKDPSCDTAKRDRADISDDGKVDDLDRDIILKGFTHRDGDL